MLITVVLPNIFVETVIYHFQESSKEQHLFEIEILCNIINVFTIIFVQINIFLLNRSINFFTKNVYKIRTPNF